MGKMGNLIVPNHTIIEALPFQHNSTGYKDQIWRYRRKLKLSAPVSLAIAKAHAELTQEICCVVREKPRGPRGGRGQMHYNGEPRFGEWWPASWNYVAKGYQFSLVAEVVMVSHYESVQAAAVSGLSEYGTAAQYGRVSIVLDEVTHHLTGDSHEASRSVCIDESRPLGESEV